jgi:hypothetical protein
MGRRGHVEFMGVDEKCVQNFKGKFEQKDSLEDVGED